jgi:hypothetical protein
MQREQLKIRGRYSNLILSVSIMLFLSACAHSVVEDPIQIYTDPVELTTTIGTAKKSVNETLQQETRLDQVLTDYGSTDPALTLGQRIAQLQSSNGPATSGLGGIFGHIFLVDAEDRLFKGAGPNKGKWNKDAPVTQEMWGRITDFKRNSDGSGYFHVTTLVKTIHVNGGPTTRRVAYHWEVDVGSGGFSVHKNCHKFADENCDPDDSTNKQPFWKTMDLSDDMLNEVVARNFHYKLWAKGLTISVRKVYRRNSPSDDIPAPPPPTGQTAPWKLLNAAKYAGLYLPSVESCIDMMTVAVSPTDMNNFPQLPFYCLGRCDSPAIVNSR